MRKAFILLSHRLLREQEEELKEVWGVNEILPLPEELQRLWSNIPPHLKELSPYLEPLWRWLEEKAQPEDVAVIQGDFGATYLAVQRAFQLGITPLYATTERVVCETIKPDGSVKQERLFRHVLFRVYGR